MSLLEQEIPNNDDIRVKAFDISGRGVFFRVSYRDYTAEGGPFMEDFEVPVPEQYNQQDYIQALSSEIKAFLEENGETVNRMIANGQADELPDLIRQQMPDTGLPLPASHYTFMDVYPNFASGHNLLDEHVDVKFAERDAFQISLPPGVTANDAMQVIRDYASSDQGDDPQAELQALVNDIPPMQATPVDLGSDASLINQSGMVGGTSFGHGLK